MSKSPDARHASMAELRTELQSAEAQLSSPGSETAIAVDAARNVEQLPVVAILPFINATGDTANDFIGVGIWEVLMANAASLPDLTVASRSSVLEYRGAGRRIEQISRELGTRWVVDGSYQRFEDQIRLTVTLFDAQADRLTWSSQLDGVISKIFELQSALARQIAEALAPAARPPSARFPTQSPQAFSNYVRARVLLERQDVSGNISSAVELLEQALKLDPRFALAHAALGEAYWSWYGQSMRTEWTMKALSALTEALRLDPNQAEVRRTVAIIYKGTGRSQEALEELRLALKSEPENDEIHRRLGEVLFELGRKDEAIACFETAIRLRPNFWRNHGTLGLAWYRMADYTRAIQVFTRVVELQPDNAWGFQILGTAQHASGKIEQALANYQRSMSISPTASAATNIGTICYAKKDYAEALRFYELAARLKPNEPVHYRNLGDAYLKMENAEKARESYERAVQLTEELIRVNPRNSEALSRLAVCEAKIGRFESARKHAMEASACQPLSVEITYRRAVVQALAGKLDEAAGYLKQAVDNGFSLSRVVEDDDLQELRSSQQYLALFGPPAGDAPDGDGGVGS
jgi:tetratricopeptide (TPR) repeat protein